MKAKNIILSLMVGLGLLGTSCTDGLDEINRNPNSPDPGTVFYKSDLATALRAGATLDGGDIHQRIKNINVDIFSQYFETSSGRRSFSPNDAYNDLYWSSHYRWMYLLNTVLETTNDDPALANYTALARVWRVFIQSQSTDYFGPMPFPKNTDGETAEYETLADQYKFFFSELAAAAEQFDDSKNFMTPEDNIYFGQIDKWRKFTNSLRLRLALKVSEIDPALCATEAKAAVAATGGLMELGGDARIGSVDGWGNQYNYYMYQVSWGDKSVMVTSMEKILTGIGGLAYDGTALVAPAKTDPRASRYFDPSSTGDIWRGIAPGLPAGSDELSNLGKDYAFLSQIYIIPNNTRPTDVFLYPEVCFLMAEAAERGFISGGTALAATWYKQGVEASFENWKVSGDASTYLASVEKNSWGTSAKYDDVVGAGNTKLEKIITQKYIANFPDQAYQAWNDKRRLNLPAFEIPKYIDPGAGTYPNDGNIRNPDNFISRMTYPQTEALINETRYKAGVAQLRDGDKTSSPLWWASKRSNYVTSN